MYNPLFICYDYYKHYFRILWHNIKYALSMREKRLDDTIFDLKTHVYTINYDIKELKKSNRDLRDKISDIFETNIDLEKTCNGVAAKVITIGKFKGHDYVEIHSITEKDFDTLVPHIKHLAKYSNINHIDSLHGNSFSKILH